MKAGGGEKINERLWWMKKEITGGGVKKRKEMMEKLYCYEGMQLGLRRGFLCRLKGDEELEILREGREGVEGF